MLLLLLTPSETVTLLVTLETDGFVSDKKEGFSADAKVSTALINDHQQLQLI